MSSKRIFLGIPVSGEIREGLITFIQPYLERTGFRWVRAENYHITVVFMGDVPEERLTNIKELLRIGLAKVQAFELPFQAYVWAPRPQDSRMIWARYQKVEAFRDLVQQVWSYYEQISPEVQQRKNPIPHITLARFKPEADRAGMDFPRHPLAGLLVDRLILWESVLGPEGVRYVPLETYALGVSQ
ncbi:MAG: RNA 2',3'-cyclic phosphodiesterase [Bacteroidota bacterium]